MYDSVFAIQQLFEGGLEDKVLEKEAAERGRCARKSQIRVCCRKKQDGDQHIGGPATATTSVWVSPRTFDKEFLFVPVSNKWVAATTTYLFGSLRPDQDSSEPLFRRQKHDDHQHREGASHSHDFSMGFSKAF
jgi:hypothetical protein